MSEPLPRPGWYDDPRGEAELRWWDGTAWTERTAARPAAAPPAAAPPLAQAPPATPPAPPAQPPPAQPPPAAQPAQPLSGTPRGLPVRPPAGPGEQPSVEIGGAWRPLATWWRRALAFILDGVIKLAFSIPAIIIAIVIAANIDWGSIDLQRLQDGQTVDGRIPGLSVADTARLGGAFLVLIASALLVEMTYQPLTMARKGANNGRTWGMQAFHIRVVRDNGSPMTYGPALVREFLVMYVLYGLISAIGNAVTVIGGTAIVLVFYLWPLWDSQNRAVQDFICSTHVVAD